MSQHFLLSRQAKTLSLATVFWRLRHNTVGPSLSLWERS